MPNLVRRDQIESANQLSLITTYGLTPVLGARLFSVLSLITNVLARHFELLPGAAGEPRAVLQRGDVPGRRASSCTSSARSAATAARPPGDEQPSLRFAVARGAVLHPALAPGRRPDHRPGRRVRGGRRGDRRGQDLRPQPRRRQRGLRRAVRRGVRRPRLGHGVRAADRPRPVAAPAVRAVDRVRRRCASILTAVMPQVALAIDLRRSASVSAPASPTSPA